MDIPQIALVLSGGSVRTAAHIGVLMAMEDYAIKPSIVTGTSGGSIVASLLASGMTPVEIKDLFMSMQKSSDKIIDFNWLNILLGVILQDRTRLTGLVKGVALQQIIKNNLKQVKTFQDVTNLSKTDSDVTSLFILAVNLHDGKQTVFCDTNSLSSLTLVNGEVAGFRICEHAKIDQAVRASISIPGIFTPAAISVDEDCYCYRSRSKLGDLKSMPKTDHYVDGGLRDGYPITVPIKLAKAKYVIGVNLGYAGMRRDHIFKNAPSEILSQSLDIMMKEQFIGDLNDRDVQHSKIITINPLIYDIGTFELEYIPNMIERGYEVTLRLFHEKKLSKQLTAQENIRRLFKTVGHSYVYPKKGTQYFNDLLANPISSVYN